MGHRKEKIKGMREGKKTIDERRLCLSIRVALSLFFLWPIMKSFLVLALLLLCCCTETASAAAGAFSADKVPENSSTQGGGLACFLVAQGGDEKKGTSCDEVCGAQDAVCVSVENSAPAYCTIPINKDAKCRCCRAVR